MGAEDDHEIIAEFPAQLPLAGEVEEGGLQELAADARLKHWGFLRVKEGWADAKHSHFLFFSVYLHARLDSRPEWFSLSRKS